MEAKHTKGPWQYELAPSGGFDIETGANDVGRYMVIASRSSHEGRIDEMHANARLIASAPEMYAQLQTFTWWAGKLAARESLSDALRRTAAAHHEIGKRLLAKATQ